MQAIYSSSNGRTVVGQAKSLKQARMVLRRMLDIHPAMTLTVWERPKHMQDILGLPAGFVYSVSYTA